MISKYMISVVCLVAGVGFIVGGLHSKYFPEERLHIEVAAIPEGGGELPMPDPNAPIEEQMKTVNEVLDYVNAQLDSVNLPLASKGDGLSLKFETYWAKNSLVIHLSEPVTPDLIFAIESTRGVNQVDNSFSGKYKLVVDYSGVFTYDEMVEALRLSLLNWWYGDRMNQAAPPSFQKEKGE